MGANPRPAALLAQPEQQHAAEAGAPYARGCCRLHTPPLPQLPTRPATHVWGAGSTPRGSGTRLAARHPARPLGERQRRGLGHPWASMHARAPPARHSHARAACPETTRPAEWGSWCGKGVATWRAHTALDARANLIWGAGNLDVAHRAVFTSPCPGSHMQIHGAAQRVPSKKEALGRTWACGGQVGVVRGPQIAGLPQHKPEALRLALRRPTLCNTTASMSLKQGAQRLYQVAGQARQYASKSGKERKVAVLGAGGGIGQPLSMLMKVRLAGSMQFWRHAPRHAPRSTTLLALATVRAADEPPGHAAVPLRYRGHQGCGRGHQPCEHQGHDHGEQPPAPAMLLCVACPMLIVSHMCRAQGYEGPESLGDALKGCDLVIIPAGVPRKPGMTRDDLFKASAAARLLQAATPRPGSTRSGRGGRR